MINSFIFAELTFKHHTMKKFLLYIKWFFFIAATSLYLLGIYSISVYLSEVLIKMMDS